jgi:hypothetical protein
VPPEVGNQDWLVTYWMSEAMIPSAIPATQAIPNEVKRARRAAASAGTICSGRVSVSSWVIDAARIPTPPAITDASSVFSIDSRLGERPPSIAATSFSDAARVARPKRVNRYSAARAMASTITIPVRMKRSTGITALSTLTVLWGRTVGSGCWVVPKASSIEAWRTSRTPSEETSLASGAAVRSGRKATTSVSAPTVSTITRLASRAGAVDQCSRSRRSAQNA